MSPFRIMSDHNSERRAKQREFSGTRALSSSLHRHIHGIRMILIMILNVPPYFLVLSSPVFDEMAKAEEYYFWESESGKSPMSSLVESSRDRMGRDENTDGTFIPDRESESDRINIRWIG